jgi:phage terminase large subunit-like protein
MEYKARLTEILEKRRSGVLNLQDSEDFAKITRYIKTKDYPSYCKAIRPTYKWAWFQEYTQQRLNNAFEKKNGRVIGLQHQQSAKSELYARCAVSYCFGKFPEWKILYLTYSDTRAKVVAGDILGLITTSEYSDIFPEVQLKDDVRDEVRTAKMRRQKLTISNFTNMASKRGEFYATGIEGSYNGFDANLIILDDFFSGYEEANSPTIRDKRWQAFVNNIITRQQKDTVILVMSTNWHADDIIGRLKDYIKNKPANTPDWEVIQFDALKDERDYPYDPRLPGEYLWPEQRMDVYLEKQALDPIGWMTTYQNIPPTTSGVIFDASCFRWYDEPVNPKGMQIVISIDPNYKKDSKQGDEAAIVVLGFQANKVYLLDFSAVNKVDILDNCQRIKQYIIKYPNYYAVLVEVKGQGEDIVTLLNDEGIGKVNSYDPKNIGKLYRAQVMIPYCRAGQFLLPSPELKDSMGFPVCPNIQKYVNEFMRFTGFEGGIDNCVDATSQAFIEYGYLLEPIKISMGSYHIKNEMGIGRGLTQLSNPMKRLMDNGNKKKPAWANRR